MQADFNGARHAGGGPTLTGKFRGNSPKLGGGLYMTGYEARIATRVRPFLLRGHGAEYTLQCRTGIALGRLSQMESRHGAYQTMGRGSSSRCVHWLARASAKPAAYSGGLISGVMRDGEQAGNATCAVSPCDRWNFVMRQRPVIPSVRRPFRPQGSEATSPPKTRPRATILLSKTVPLFHH